MFNFKGKLKLPTLTFGLSMLIFTFVNKYVLWILRFTYPTIYQSWQMAFAFMFQLTAAVFGYIKFPTLSLSHIKEWIPCTGLFALQIYSGSVALTNLAVPLFCAIQNLTLFIGFCIEILLQQKKIVANSIGGLLLSITGISIAAYFDPEARFLGYKWISIHVLSTSLYFALARRIPVNQISETDRMMYNSFFSIIYLLFIGVVTGEVYESMKFPYLYYGRFHCACFISGTLCGILGLCLCHLRSSTTPDSIKLYSTIVSATIGVVSPLIFQMTITVPHALGISISLAGSIIYSYERVVKERDLEEAPKLADC